MQNFIYFCSEFNIAIVMLLSTDSILLTDDIDGFRLCRETRSEKSTTVLLCTAGHIDVYYRGQMLRIAKDELFIRIPRATELGPYQFSEDFQFMQISIPNDIFEELMYDHMRIEPRWWQKQEYLKIHPLFPLNEPSKEFCFAYFRLLSLQLQDINSSGYRKQIMMAIARAATLELLNFLDKKLPVDGLDERASVNSSDYLFHAFTNMLRENPHEREVQWYAKRLNITPKYLSEVCKERSGKSASEWIADVTVTELKHYLRETTLPIHEIAAKMEFPNASFFCQYTKKHTGLTPNHYRKHRVI